MSTIDRLIKQAEENARQVRETKYYWLCTTIKRARRSYETIGLNNHTFTIDDDGHHDLVPRLEVEFNITIKVDKVDGYYTRYSFSFNDPPSPTGRTLVDDNVAWILSAPVVGPNGVEVFIRMREVADGTLSALEQNHAQPGFFWKMASHGDSYFFFLEKVRHASRCVT